MTSFFFFNDTATTEIYTLSLHDALPISLDSAETGDDRLREPVREVGARGVRGLEVQDGNARGLRHGLRHNGDAAGAAEPRVGEPRPPSFRTGGRGSPPPGGLERGGPPMSPRPAQNPCPPSSFRKK